MITTTSGTNWRKVISPKVRKKRVKKYQEKTAIRRVQLVGQIAPHRIGIASKYMPNKAIRRVGFD